MEKSIKKFMNGAKLSNLEMFEVLNTIALFDINDEYVTTNVYISRTCNFTHADIYKQLKKQFTFIEQNMCRKRDYNDESFIILQHNETKMYYRFSFEYYSYADMVYHRGSWSLVSRHTKTITYYDYYNEAL